MQTRVYAGKDGKCEEFRGVKSCSYKPLQQEGHQQYDTSLHGSTAEGTPASAALLDLHRASVRRLPSLCGLPDEPRGALCLLQQRIDTVGLWALVRVSQGPLQAVRPRTGGHRGKVRGEGCGLPACSGRGWGVLCPLPPAGRSPQCGAGRVAVACCCCRLPWHAPRGPLRGGGAAELAAAIPFLATPASRASGGRQPQVQGWGLQRLVQGRGEGRELHWGGLAEGRARSRLQGQAGLGRLLS